MKQIKIILASKEQYQKELDKKNFGLIETEIKMIDAYFYAEQYHQQYQRVKEALFGFANES